MPKMEIYKLRLLFASPGPLRAWRVSRSLFLLLWNDRFTDSPRQQAHNLYVFLVFPLLITLVSYTDPRLAWRRLICARGDLRTCQLCSVDSFKAGDPGAVSAG